MNLNSVRTLKADLQETVLKPLNESGATLRSLLAPTESMARGSVVRPSLALGVSRRGRRDFRLAVRVQHRTVESSPHLDAIRKAAKGEIDEDYVGRIVKRADLWHRQRNRPLRIGGSAGHYLITAGTLGVFVRGRSAAAAKHVLMLSNNHVLANENNAEPDDPILQCGALDGGRRPRDVAATLTSFVKLKARGVNRIDAAVARLRDGIDHDPRRLEGLGELAGAGDVIIDEGDEVAKIGRTTGLTHGRVTAFELDNVVVAYEMGNLRFDNQIEIEGAGDQPFSAGGDSGSLIVDDQLRGVALLFAGGDIGGSNGKGLTYAHPLHNVLESLKVELLY